MMAGVAAEVVDYLLFVDEAPLANRVQGSSGFAERFAATGPRDTKGTLAARARSHPPSPEIPVQLLDLLRGVRLRCPPAAKDADLSADVAGAFGDGQGERYRAALPLADRRAIVEILKETKSDLPAYLPRGEPITVVDKSDGAFTFRGNAGSGDSCTEVHDQKLILRVESEIFHCRNLRLS